MAKFLATLLASAVFTLFAGNACAVPTYEVTDLVDAAGDPNRMMITYRLTDSFEAGGGLTLSYDAATFSDLAVIDPGSDWLVSVTSPDASVALEGLISFMALADVTGPTRFDVEFTYLGAGFPGSQAFELFDSNFNVTSSGRTVPFGTQIPEPSTSFLLSIGLLMFVRAGRRHIAPVSMTS